MLSYPRSHGQVVAEVGLNSGLFDSKLYSWKIRLRLESHIKYSRHLYRILKLVESSEIIYHQPLWFTEKEIMYSQVK